MRPGAEQETEKEMEASTNKGRTDAEELIGKVIKPLEKQ